MCLAKGHPVQTHTKFNKYPFLRGVEFKIAVQYLVNYSAVIRYMYCINYPLIMVTVAFDKLIICRTYPSSLGNAACPVLR